MKKVKERQEIFEVENDIRINESIILEKGDRIQIINESNELKAGIYLLIRTDDDDPYMTEAGYFGTDLNRFKNIYDDYVLKQKSPSELAEMILSSTAMSKHVIYYTILTKSDFDSDWKKIARYI